MKSIIRIGLMGCLAAFMSAACNGTHNNGFNEDSTGTMGAPSSADSHVNTNPPPQMTRDTTTTFHPSDSAVGK